MSYRFRPILISLAAISIFSLTILSSGADDLLSSAAGEFRDKDYDAAYTLAGKSAESPQRSFMRGVSALRAGKPEEALSPLLEAEQKFPLLADYAALYQAEALLELKKYPEAAAKAVLLAKAYPASLLLRRSGKLHADALLESGDPAGALKVFQAFVEKYPSGSDAVDAIFQAARCRENLGDSAGALQIYRNLWINNPATSQAL